MTDQHLPLSAFYADWGEFQSELIETVTPLTPEQWALPVAPTHWPIERLVRHIVSVRAWWFHLWMGEGDAELAAIARWEDEGAPVRSGAELVAGLEATWQVIERSLAKWTAADLAQVFRSPAEPTEEEHTRKWILFHVLRHDIHHGGELALGMGGYDLPTIWRF